MVKQRVVAVAVGLTVLSSSWALAGPYTDDLSKCLVSSTTEKDKTNLVRWIFSAAALHPDVSDIAAVSAQQRTAMSRNIGQVFMRLLTDSCRSEYRDALQYEGNQTIEVSFSVLGQVAMRNLMQDPAVLKGVGELETFLDVKKLEAVAKRVSP